MIEFTQGQQDQKIVKYVFNLVELIALLQAIVGDDHNQDSTLYSTDKPQFAGGNVDLSYVEFYMYANEDEKVVPIPYSVLPANKYIPLKPLIGKVKELKSMANQYMLDLEQRSPDVAKLFKQDVSTIKV